MISRGHKLWMAELTRIGSRREYVGFGILGVELLSSAGIRVLKYSALSHRQIEGRAFELRDRSFRVKCSGVLSYGGRSF